MNKTELMNILKCDALANGINSIKKRRNNEIWNYIYTMRMVKYYRTICDESHNKIRKRLFELLFKIWHSKWRKLSIKLGITMGYSRIGKGFSIAHYGLLTINGGAIIGDYCRVHEGVCIGATNKGAAPKIGNYVFIGTGAKIIGDVSIADYVQIGAGSVVTKTISEPHTTWAGVPAQKISNNDSRSNLRREIFEHL